jgi:hypothetical protein
MGGTADVAQLVSAVAASVAAIFAAVSAGVSRAAVERSNLAFVWPEYWIEKADAHHVTDLLLVRLHSDGPGIALDARWSLCGVPERGRRTTWGRAWLREEEAAGASATWAIRALRPGETSGSIERSVDADELEDEPWWIVVRWSDSGGRRWSFSEGSRGRELAPKPGGCGDRGGKPLY